MDCTQRLLIYFVLLTHARDTVLETQKCKGLNFAAVVSLGILKNINVQFVNSCDPFYLVASLLIFLEFVV